jgi:ClpP class serine protease
MTIRHVRPGEALAFHEASLRKSRDAFFWLSEAPNRDNEYREDGIAVVRVNGPLEHHEDPCADSYDALVCRVQEAFDSDSRAVVLALNSPGGVVAGLTQCVSRMRAIAKASSKRFVAYVDEESFSAAYAASCACDEIVIPPSGITGSIGVISTMVDVTAADATMGIRVVTITSGTHKADGHPHVPISDDAIAAEEGRVEKLAIQFFRLVRTSRPGRGLTIDKIRGFQAGIFLGKEAVDAGVADAVMPFDELLATLSDTPQKARSGTSQAKPLAQNGSRGSHSSQPGTQLEQPMSLSIEALIKRTGAAMAAEKDPKKKAALAANLDAFKKTKHSIEKHETEEGEDKDDDKDGENDEDDKDDDGEDKDDDKKKKSEDPPKKKDAKKKSGDEPEAEDEGDEAEALAASVRRATGKSGAAAQGALEALVSKAKFADGLAARLSALEAKSASDARANVIGSALAANRITKAEAKSLGTRPMAHVEAFLEARPRGLVYTQSEDMPVPQMQNPDGSSVLPTDLEAQLDAAVRSSNGAITREQVLAEYNKTAKSSMNGRA